MDRAVERESGRGCSGLGECWYVLAAWTGQITGLAQGQENSNESHYRISPLRLLPREASDRRDHVSHHY